MRALGLDVGDKTIGIAISDPLGMFAQPVETLRRVGRRKDLEKVARLVAERDVATVVVGLPVRTDGVEGPEAEKVRQTAEALIALLEGVELVFQDERFTTAQAQRALIQGGMRRKKRKQVVDQVAAVLILQSWLDSRSS